MKVPTCGTRKPATSSRARFAKVRLGGLNTKGLLLGVTVYVPPATRPVNAY